ncbi:MAG: hypothetical protein ACO3UU_11355, partial [Minisyncoccia bacterium]
MSNKLYVDTQINNLIGGAPSTLNTLDEIAQALADQSNFSDLVVYKAQTQTINGDKTFSGTTTFTGSLIANGATITPTELSYLDNATSNIQTQINDIKNGTFGDNIVHINTAETITGAKTFTENVRVTDAKGININSLTTNIIGDRAFLNLFESGNNWGFQLSNDAGDDTFRISKYQNGSTTDKLTMTGTTTTHDNTTTSIKSGGTEKINVGSATTTLNNTTTSIKSGVNEKINVGSTTTTLDNTTTSIISGGTEKINVGSATTKITSNNVELYKVQNVNAFTNPHLKLTTGEPLALGNRTSIAMATSFTDNYGISLSAQRYVINSGQAKFDLRTHTNSSLGDSKMTITETDTALINDNILISGSSGCSTNIVQQYLIPNNNGGAGYVVYMGRLYTGGLQGGVCNIKLCGHAGYNALNSQDFITEIFWKNSNAISVVNGYYSNSWFKTTGYGLDFTDRIGWLKNDNSSNPSYYDLYINMP